MTQLSIGALRTAELEHDDPQVKATLYTTVLSRWVDRSQPDG